MQEERTMTDQARGPHAETAGAASHTGPFYIQATTPAADERTRVLKHGDTFAVFDHYGDVKPIGLGEEGVYHEGTRYLSCLLLVLGRERPLFLSSTVGDDNELLAVDLTNPDLAPDGRVDVPRGTLHLARSKFLWNGVCHERLRLRNYGLAPITVSLALYFEADFADIFEVRGTRRTRRGRTLEPAVADSAVTLSYEGLDRVVRRTRLAFTPRPDSLSDSKALFQLSLAPQQEATVEMEVACERGETRPRPLTYKEARTAAATEVERGLRQTAVVTTSNDQFNALVRRTAADLHMLTSQTPEGLYPYAGVPWFSTPFGRDGIITALECLWLQPDLARGVLAYLAATQATEVNPEQDAEPGKILHETRGGEMAALGEIPFGRYYGSVDSTPLFVMLAGAYHERSADRVFAGHIWPNVRRALDWIERYGDVDGDGFVEYQRHSAQGLVQQGWKDSSDSVFHADGTLARAPIALCEVQAYVYGAWMAAARLSRALGQPADGDAFEARAERLRRRFAEAFWCSDLGTYALALDGRKQPCRVRTSNAGHCLLTGIAYPEHARQAAKTLLSTDSYSGWGVRTVAAGEPRYNPMSYHNGSIWPHDNALVADGMARYGLKDAVMRILGGMFDAGTYLDLYRLPELFCGFLRRPGEGPTQYPVACAPQAWSAASVFLLLRACLGLEVNAVRGEIAFDYPILPAFLREVHVRGLCVGNAALDLTLLRHGNDVGINVTRKEGEVRVLMVK